MQGSVYSVEIQMVMDTEMETGVCRDKREFADDGTLSQIRIRSVIDSLATYLAVLFCSANASAKSCTMCRCAST